LENIPAWVKGIAALVLLAILYGASRLLLYLDKLPG
jgi:hypothetical protein